MKTKYDVIREVVAQKVSEGIERDIREQLGYGDRIKKAGMIVLANGVKGTGYSDFEVASGTDSGKTYAVNGQCPCQDAQNWAKHERGEKVTTYAPRGLCKHKMAVELWKHARIYLKESQERFSQPHREHRWNCTEHRDLPIECWHRMCPDPIDLDCPTCQREANVPASIEQIIVDEGAPTEEYTIDPDTGEIHEEPIMMTTIGETAKQIVTSLNGHTNGTTTEEPATPVLVPEQYEPAPVLTPKPMTLPEAGASLNIKLRMDQAEIMYTMRGHQDSEVLERLPEVLATLERILKIEVDHDEPFLKRLLHAFFPKPSRYTGK